MWYLIPNIYKNMYVQCFCLIEQIIIGQIKLIYKPDKKGLRFCFHRSPFNFFFPVKERKASYEYRIVRSISASRIRTANTRASVDVSYRRWQIVGGPLSAFSVLRGIYQGMLRPYALPTGHFYDSIFRIVHHF